MTRPRTALTVVAAAAALTACTTGQAHTLDDAHLRLVASTSILADVVQNVAGDDAQVTALMPAGTDPHTYEPGLHATRDIAYADAVFTNGLLLEPQSVERTIEATAPDRAPVVAVAEEAQRYGFDPVPLVEDASLDTVWLGLKVAADDGDGEARPATTVVDLALSDAAGPGEVSAFVLGTFGTPEVMFDSGDGIGRDDSTTLPIDAHTHVSWGFSEPGVYTLSLTAAVRDSMDTSEVRETAAQDVTVVVGLDPAAAAPGKQVIDHGHVDIATHLDAAGSRITLRGDGPRPAGRSLDPVPDVDYAPDETVIAVPTTTLQPVPPQREFRFLGDPGDDTYLLPQAVLGRHVHGELDPHFWHDVTAMKAVVQVIRDELSAAAPMRADTFTRNARRYLAELDTADEYFRDQVETVPPEHRNLVTTHHGYSYLGRAYGMSIAGFVTPNPSVQPSPRDLIALTRTLDNLDVPAVFLEPELAGRSNELTETARLHGIEVCPIRGDSLDPPGAGPATTYTDMIRSNAASISECLSQKPRTP